MRAISALVGCSCWLSLTLLAATKLVVDSDSIMSLLFGLLPLVASAGSAVTVVVVAATGASAAGLGGTTLFLLFRRFILDCSVEAKMIVLVMR